MSCHAVALRGSALRAERLRVTATVRPAMSLGRDRFLCCKPRYAGGNELGNGGGGIAELAQNLLRMLAEQGRVAVDRGPIVIEQHRVAHCLHPAEARVLDLAD